MYFLDEEQAKYLRASAEITGRTPALHDSYKRSEVWKSGGRQKLTLRGVRDQLYVYGLVVKGSSIFDYNFGLQSINKEKYGEICAIISKEINCNRVVRGAGDKDTVTYPRVSLQKEVSKPTELYTFVANSAKQQFVALATE